LGGQILANNNFGFDVYGFDIKKGTQLMWFSSSIRIKKVDLSWKNFLNLI
jgi:predicted secreted hydrolase